MSVRGVQNPVRFGPKNPTEPGFLISERFDPYRTELARFGLDQIFQKLKKSKIVSTVNISSPTRINHRPDQAVTASILLSPSLTTTAPIIVDRYQHQQLPHPLSSILESVTLGHNSIPIGGDITTAGQHPLHHRCHQDTSPWPAFGFSQPKSLYQPPKSLPKANLQI